MTEVRFEETLLHAQRHLLRWNRVKPGLFLFRTGTDVNGKEIACSFMPKFGMARSEMMVLKGVF